MLKDKPTNAPTVSEKKSHGNGSRNGIYYKIEVRSWHDPRVLHDPQVPTQPFVIDKDWKEWPIRLAYGNGNAPSMPCGYLDRHPAEHGLMTYESAMGHLWGMYAFLDANHMGLCMQARLVACKYEEKYSITEESVSDVIMAPRRPYDDFMDRQSANEKALTQER